MSHSKKLPAPSDSQPEPDEKVPHEVPSPNDPNASSTLTKQKTQSYHPQPDQQVAANQERIPKIIGRYRVEKILGQGGFGVVYLAHDDDLHRLVAIKVPQARRVSNPKDAEAYLVEAQIVAKLDHSHIVPVYDVGRSENGLPFVVSKYIEGSSLADKIKATRLSVRESATLVARMADALQYAHQHRLVHRDVKPSNILIDTSNKPFLVDFGLALKEDDFGKGGGLAGTPAYMSPEQARGEGHRVDGRSDIFSLGVVLYELLVGKRPFRGDSQAELIDQITQIEARPPRQIDGTIPKELERICLKALVKKSTERYTTAKDIAEELEHFLAEGVKQSVPQPPYSMEPQQEVVQTRQANEAYTLEIATGAEEGKFYTLDKERIVIGRNPDCDVPLSSPAVMRYHAQLVRTTDGYLIEDLKSRNGTYVNGKPIIGRVALNDKDRIHVCGWILIYHCKPSSPKE